MRKARLHRPPGSLHAVHQGGAADRHLCRLADPAHSTLVIPEAGVCTSRERRLFVPFIVFTTLFFVAGGYFGYLVAFPMVVKFLLGVGEGFKQVVTISAYFSMMSKILLGLGLVFEMPMLIFFLARLGIVTAGQLLRWFRWAVLLIFVVAAIITPTPDVATQTVFRRADDPALSARCSWWPRSSARSGMPTTNLDRCLHGPPLRKTAPYRAEDGLCSPRASA